MIRHTRLDVDQNDSLWAATAAAVDPLPPLKGEISADIAIIGGGFTGLSTAYHVSRRFPDRRVVVLEAKRVGNGASGRNGGLMLNWIQGVEVDDEARCKRVYEVTRSGIDGIEALIREHNLPVRYRRDGTLDVYTDESRAEEAHKKAEKLAKWGIPLQYLHGAELDARIRVAGARGAVLDPTGGQLHGLDLLQGMRGVIQRKGVEIYEQSPVLAVEEGKTITLTTPEGRVRAPAIVLATNGYTTRLGYFRTGMFPLHSHVIATEPLSEAQRQQYWNGVGGFSDDLDRIAYASMTPSGQIVFGGGSNQSYSYRWNDATTFPDVPESRWKAVEDRFRAYFPGLADVKIQRRWTGTLGITMSRVCSMGVQGDHRNIYHALGYSGHGVVLANLAGKVLADLYSDNHEPWKDLPFYQRSLGGIPGEPFRYVGYHVYTALTGRSPRRKDA